ncbi:MAG: hypothetical protein AB8I08_08815 [Sandaracinaceae bacterium]
MTDAFSRRGFGSLLLTGGAGLLLGATPASARRAVRPIAGRIACALTSSGLDIELHLRAQRRAPILLERHRVTLAGRLTAGGQSYTIAAMNDRFPSRGRVMRAGPTRPEMVSLGEEELHYGTFHAPTPVGLTGQGQGHLVLNATHVPSSFSGPEATSSLHRQLGRLVLRSRLRFAL